jgi:prolyl-tRNA editing enzyme YbaK/EbsC (Cys-tRNA(Pro) deacylase)
MTLGVLDWVPATGHPQLLAPAVAKFLTTWSHASAVLVAAIDPELADTAAFCEHYQVPAEASANCVVVEGRRGEVTTRAACMVLATHRADVNGVVRRRLGARKASFAAMEQTVADTAMEYGGITPLGLPPDWPVLVDDAVVDVEVAVVGSGVRRSKIALPGSLLAELPAAEVLALHL